MKKKGILLVNLGTPKDASPKEVKKYLKKFLSDKRVIKTNPIIWKPILHGIILNTRPKKSAQLYETIYKDGSMPLLHYAEIQKKNVASILPTVEVAIGMSYSEPSIEYSIDELLSKGVEDVTIIPLYPQYSGTTVGSVFDRVMNYFLKSDRIIDMKFIRSFHSHPLYIDFFVKKIKEVLEKESVDAIVFSYHGIPVSYVTDGDEYPKECTETTQLIMEKIGDVSYYQTYQSKFGPSEWLTPATDTTLKVLPQQGVKNILVIAPGFISDCLETLEELEHENKAYFMENGGEQFVYISPFNDDIAFAELIKSLVS